MRRGGRSGRLAALAVLCGAVALFASGEAQGVKQRPSAVAPSLFALSAAPLQPSSLLADAAVVSASSVQNLVARSDDGGATWVSHPATQSGVGAHVDQFILLGKGDTALGIDGDPTQTNGSAIVRSTDDGQTWSVVQKLQGTFARLEPDPNRPTAALACVVDEGLFVTDNDGLTWVKRSPAGRGCFSAAFQPRGQVVVASFSGRSPVIWRSPDRGLHWEQHPMPPVYPYHSRKRVDDNALSSIAFDSSRPTTIVATDFDGNVYRTGDAGRHWVAAWTVYSSVFFPHASSSVAEPRFSRAGEPEWAVSGAGRLIAGPYNDDQHPARGYLYYVASADHGRTWRVSIACTLASACNGAEVPAAVGTSLLQSPRVSTGANTSYLLKLPRQSTSWHRVAVTITPG